jgi:hypothetical protein
MAATAKVLKPPEARTTPFNKKLLDDLVMPELT